MIKNVGKTDRTLRFLLGLFLVLTLSLFGCNLIEDNEEEVTLSTKSVQLVENYKEEYGFEKIRIFKTVNPTTFLATLHIYAINGNDSVALEKNRKEIQINLGTDIYHSLDPGSIGDIEKVYILLTKNDGRFFFNKSHSEVMILNVDGGTLKTDFQP